MAQGNILVVDDDESVRRLLMEYLRERSSMNVDGARDGVEALHQGAVKTYAVGVLDVMMPHMSGIDFLTSLDALLSDPSVKSQTAHSRLSQQKGCEKCGSSRTT